MLIPQYSIRWLLAVTAVCAGIFSILALGVRGSRWAAGVSVALGSLVILMAVYVLWFALVWAVAAVVPRLARRRFAASPFRESPIPTGSPFAGREAPAKIDRP